MAKNKFSRKNFLEQIKRPELWIGVFTVGILLGVAGGTYLKNTKKPVAKKQIAVTPMQSDSQASPSAMASSSASVRTTTYQPGIKKLAYTSSTMEVVVLKNESFWHIAKRICGDAKSNFIAIQDLNENINLHPGMTVKVVCE